MPQDMSSAVVMIDALRVKILLEIEYYFKLNMKPSLIIDELI